MSVRFTQQLQKPAFWFGLAVALLTLLPYLGVGGFALVNHDDYLYIKGSPVGKGLTPENVKWAFLAVGDMANWHPLTWLSYMADASLWRLAPGAMHIHSAALHAANAALVFVLLAAVLRRLEAGGGLGRFTVRPSASHWAGGSAVGGTQDGRDGSPLPSAVRPAIPGSDGEARSGRDGSPLPSADSDDRDVGRECVACACGRTLSADGRGLPSLPADLRLLTAAALAALFWSLHPLRVESVAWVSSRKDVLFLFWELLALIFWVRGIETGNDSRGGAGARSSTDGGEEPGKGGHAAAFRFASLLCFALAGMAKPTAMTFPVLAGLLEFLMVRRVRFAALMWPFLLSLGLAAITQFAQASGGATAALAGVPFSGRLLNAVAAFGTYCWKTVCPSGLAVPYEHRWPDMPLFFWPGLALCAAYGIVLLWSGRRCGAWQILTDVLPPSIRRGVCAGLNLQPTACSLQPFPSALFVGLAWFLVAVTPMLGLAKFGFHSHADRYTYLPAIGFSLLLAVALAGTLGRGRAATGATLALSAAVLAAWSALAWGQAQHWRNDNTLFSHTVRVTGEGNQVAQRGLTIYTFGMTESAEEALPHAEALFRHHRDAHRLFQDVYVFLLAKAGRFEDAQREARDLTEWAERQRNSGIERVDVSPSDIFNWLEMQGSGTDVFSSASRVCYAAIAYYKGERDLAAEHVSGVLGTSGANPIANYLAGLMALEKGQVAEACGFWRLSVREQTLFAFLQGRIDELEKTGAAKREAH